MRCVSCGSGLNENRNGLFVCRTCQYIQWYTIGNEIVYKVGLIMRRITGNVMMVWDEVEV
jgi:hypothetical protein